MRRRFMTVRANRSYLARSRSKNVSLGLWRVIGCSIQTDKMGTKVLESRYEPTMEKPTAKASGTNRLCAAPVMKNAGMKTARMQSTATNRGSVVSAVAISKMGVDVLDGDRRLVDKDSDGQRQAAQGHDVDRLTRYPERRYRRQN